LTLKGQSKIFKHGKAHTLYVSIPSAIVKDSAFTIKEGDIVKHFDPEAGMKMFLLLGILLVSYVGGDFSFGGPLTHSRTITPGSVLDPSTKIWNDLGGSATNNGLSLFNTLGNVTGQSKASAATCAQVATGSGSCLEFGQNPQFPQLGLTKMVSDMSINAGSDLPQQHKIFYQNGRWWTFYIGPNGRLNYTTSVALTGPWVEHPGGLGATPQMGEGTEFAIDTNSTYVFVTVADRSTHVYFWKGNLLNSGTITWSPFQVIFTGTGQTQDPDILFQANGNRVYIFFDEANNCASFAGKRSCYQYTESNGPLTTWFTPKDLIDDTFSAISTGCPGDITGASADIGNGSIMAGYYGFFFANSCQGSNTAGIQPIPGFHTQVLTGSVMNPRINIPATPGYFSCSSGTSCCSSIFSAPCNLGFEQWLFQTAPGNLTQIVNYGIYDAQGCNGGGTPCNTTYEMTPFFSTFTTASNSWTIPARSPNDNGRFLMNIDNTHIAGKNEVTAFSYDPNTKRYVGQHVVGAQVPVGSTIYEVVFDSNFKVLDLTGPPITFINGANYLGSSTVFPTFVQASVATPYISINGTQPNEQLWVVEANLISQQQYGLALSTQPVGDLSVAVGKELEFQQNYAILNPSVTSDGDFGFFLTLNGTLPTQNLVSYHPLDDPNVVLFYAIDKGGSSSFTEGLHINRHPGVTTLRSQETGACDGTGDCYFFVTFNSANSPDWTNVAYMLLNYTGASQTTASVATCLANSAGPNLAPACSYITDHNTFGANVIVPQLNLQSSNYYLGFWKGVSQTGVLDFCTDLGSPCGTQVPEINGGCMSASMELDYCLPVYVAPAAQNTPPSVVDTGGWFGSIGRFLGSTFAPVTSFLAPIINPVVNFLSGIEGALISGLNGSRLSNGWRLSVLVRFDPK